MTNFHHLPSSRRDFLAHIGGGLGGIALAQLLGESGLLAETPAEPHEIGRAHV